MNLRALATAFVLGLALLPSLPAATVNYGGALDAGDPTFNRPAGLTTLSAVGTSVSFETFQFSLSLADTVTITVTSANIAAVGNGNPNDSYLLLYAGAFNPASPLTNLVAFNDDIGGGNFLSSINGFAASAGTLYTVVMTTFNNGAFGTYNNSITTPNAAIITVPEPSSIVAMGVLGLAGVTVLRRRRAA